MIVTSGGESEAGRVGPHTGRTLFLGYAQRLCASAWPVNCRTATDWPTLARSAWGVGVQPLDHYVRAPTLGNEPRVRRTEEPRSCDV